ncbi:MAG: MerR family transcriptional regulator [Opitutales bacterium]|nr:MerR family transcriptional regulator [Opitutales bacterium]MBT5813651.1 MerR family transcriptional regulator [Opitutales bacterium]
MIFNAIDKKKSELDALRPLSGELVKNLEEWFRIELTYTSNAIEGNTLTRRETALVVEKGITVGGKTLAEHLEATNHAEALDWAKDQIKRRPNQISFQDTLRIHNLILKGIDDAHAGHYRSVPVRVSGSTVVFQNPRKVPDLMDAFHNWLKTKPKLHPIELAAEAHYRLVTIHPFVDGNGRTARLLMNLILIMQGYPPAFIRKRDRLNYIATLEKAQTGGPKDPFVKLISKAVERSFDIYLKAVLQEEDSSQTESDALLKIGELAKRIGVPNSTIRHWTKEGLLEVAETTHSGYQMYNVDMIERIEKIMALKEKRLTLEEIKKQLHE